MIDQPSALLLLQSASTTEHLSSNADAPDVVAADRSTVVVAATRVKRIDRSIDLELRGSAIDW